jgi:hypothetical protein
MTRVLSSARMRRRLIWGGLFLAVAGMVAGLIVLFPSPKPPEAEKMTTIEGDVVKQDKPRAFSPRKAEILAVAQQFVQTAVRRHNTAQSWDLVCPSLKHGYTRAAWAKGDIPVVPFPVAFGRWRVGYSFEKEVDLQVALFPPKNSQQRATVFDLTLERCNASGRHQWLVAEFMPAPAPGGDFGDRRSRIGFKNDPTVTPPKRASTLYLFLPLGIFGLLVATIGAFVVRSWRSRRTYNAYVRERQMSSTRPS